MIQTLGNLFCIAVVGALAFFATAMLPGCASDRPIEIHCERGAAPNTVGQLIGVLERCGETAMVTR